MSWRPWRRGARPAEGPVPAVAEFVSSPARRERILTLAVEETNSPEFAAAVAAVESPVELRDALELRKLAVELWADDLLLRETIAAYERADAGEDA